SLQKIIGIDFEELQVVLEDAEAVAKLVGPSCNRGVTGHVGGHLHQCVASDAKHLFAAWPGDQIRLGSRERAPSPIGIERIAHTELEQLRYGEFVAQSRPDVAGLLRG